MLHTGDCHRGQGHLSASPTDNVTGWMVIHSLLPTGSHLPPCAPCTLSFLPCLARHDSSHGSRITRMCLAALTNARIDKNRFPVKFEKFFRRFRNISLQNGKKQCHPGKLYRNILFALGQTSFLCLSIFCVADSFERHLSPVSWLNISLCKGRLSGCSSKYRSLTFLIPA